MTTSRRSAVMNGTLAPLELARYAVRQVNVFFPDRHPLTPQVVRPQIAGALGRLERCLAGLTVSRFYRDGRPWFDHLNSEQYAMFLYLLASECGRAGARGAATKFYLLNKALHGLEAYFEIELPEVFYLAHPVGTVLGRARYGNYFLAMQGCTVGNAADLYPTFGERVVLCAHSIVLGDCRMGDESCVGAGSLVFKTHVPARTTATGRGRDLKVVRKPADLWQHYFRETPAGH